MKWLVHMMEAHAGLTSISRGLAVTAPIRSSFSLVKQFTTVFAIILRFDTIAARQLVQE